MARIAGVDLPREKRVETEVTYEDGRKGKIRATVRIEDATVHGERPSIREAAE